MLKYLLLITLSLIFSFEFNSSEPTRKSYALNVMPMATPPVQSETDKLVLDKNEICLPCPSGVKEREGFDCDTSMVIKVFAAKNDKAIYHYTVSVGRIIGEGSEVLWDVSEVRQPGSYQIKVEIEDKAKGQNSTHTKTITIADGNCGCLLCDCPTLTVDASKYSVETGETMIFTASVSGGSSEDITYKWTVSDGEIIEGQGTPYIKVATNSKMADKTVKATVEIGGICEECTKTESGGGSVVSPKRVK